jgi:NAD(P)-dependent dehydrogenase (short-subunit alcohol dehydrogenase family)
VTGSSGRGTASDIARVFAREGAATVITGRSATDGQAIVDEVRAEGHTAVYVRSELTDDESCRQLVAAAVAEFGKLTVLVNSAVRHHPDAYGSLIDLDDDTWRDAWDQTMRVSPRGWAWMCRCAIPAMIDAGHGSIVHIGSRTAIRGVPGTAARTASRGAVHALSRAIAVDFARCNIRSNVVSPGAIVGKEREGPDGKLDEAAIRRLEETNWTRPPTTLDIAYAALFLASSESGAITGHTITVDGGSSAAGPYKAPPRVAATARP